MGHKGNRRVYIYIAFGGNCSSASVIRCFRSGSVRRVEKRGKGGWKDGWWRRRLSEVIKWRAKFDWD